MKLTLTRHLWGVEQPWEQCFPTFAKLGYGLIECPLPGEADRQRFTTLLAANGLGYVAMGFTGSNPDTVDGHLQDLRQQVRTAKALGARFINVHAGKDWMSVTDGVRFFTAALEVERAEGLKICFETHRGRLLYNSRDTRDILEQVPGLTLCADFSHWVAVAERMLDVDADALRLVASRVHHIHARVGHEEGPQVPDPRDPAWQRQLHAHEAWWDMIWESQAQRGYAETTLTPEFGPPGYMWTQPYTGMPLANLWDVCHWQGARQAERFIAKFAKTATAR